MRRAAAASSIASALLFAFAFLVLVALNACAAPAKRAALVTATTVRIPVKVPTYRVPPPALLACGSDRPDFRFYLPADKRFSVAMKPGDAPKLRGWVDRKQSCLEAWRAWAQ